MNVIVKRGDVVFTCTNDEQLNSFLEDGYAVVEDTAAPDEKPKKKTTKATK